MKGINDLKVFFSDNVSKEKELIAKNTWSVIEELFGNYSPITSLIDQAITEGLATIKFVDSDDKDIPTGAAYTQDFKENGIIKINADMHPVDLIDAFLFELGNSVNSEIKNVIQENYENADEYANAVELAEYKTYINNKELVLDFLQSNKEKVEELLIQSHYPESYVRIVHDVKEQIELKYISPEDLEFLIKHREGYVQDWEEWKNKKDTIYNFQEISKAVEVQDNQKLEKLLSSLHAIVEEIHINKAIESGNSKNLELLLNKYKNTICDSQLIKAIDKPELIKLLLPYLSDTYASYQIGEVIGHLSKTGNTSAITSLLNEYKGEIYEYDLPTIRNKEILKMVKNYPNFEPDVSVDGINLESTNQSLIGTVPQDSFDLLI